MMISAALAVPGILLSFGNIKYLFLAFPLLSFGLYRPCYLAFKKYVNRDPYPRGDLLFNGMTFLIFTIIPVCAWGALFYPKLN
jgi:hypothetical protein